MFVARCDAMTARGVRPTTGGSGPVVEMLFGLTILGGAVWSLLSALRARGDKPSEAERDPPTETRASQDDEPPPR